MGAQPTTKGARAAIEFKTVDDYIASFPPGVEQRLELVRQAVLRGIPGAEETISYQIPTFKVNGKYILYFAGWKHHLAVYPIPELEGALELKVKGYRAGKGTLRFPFGEPTPYRLIESIAAALLANRGAAERSEPAAS